MATDLIGHQRPFFAPIAAVVSLNGARRMRRAVELVVGVSVGVGVGDLLISVIGSGPWQIGLVVALAMTTAVWLDGVAHAIGAIRGDQGLSSHVILGQLRSAAVDLLQASGLPRRRADARHFPHVVLSDALAAIPMPVIHSVTGS